MLGEQLDIARSSHLCESGYETPAAGHDRYLPSRRQTLVRRADEERVASALVDEVVVRRPASGRGTVAHVDLVEDVRHVMLDGIQGDI